MAKDFIKFKGMSFNKTILGAKTKEEFIAHEQHNFQNPDGSYQTEVMNELYDKHLIKPVSTETAPENKKAIAAKDK